MSYSLELRVLLRKDIGGGTLRFRWKIIRGPGDEEIEDAVYDTEEKAYSAKGMAKCPCCNTWVLKSFITKQ